MATIFEKYYKDEEFIDRKELKAEDPVDVIIPIFNTNALFEKNLKSFYREIPINKLIIGDGGSTDDSLEILSKFPRVKIINQSKHKTLGFCLKELISSVETDWFVYLHADVYLPKNWYDDMIKYKDKYDWYECGARITVQIEYDINLKSIERSYSGSQIGKTTIFRDIIPKIDDDYLYRNEDIILQELILLNGYKWGRISNTYHYHQVMNRRGKKEPEFNKVTIEKFTDQQWEIRTHIMQLKGIIKYLKPKPHLIKSVNININLLRKYNALNIGELKSWVLKTNKEWYKYIEFNQPLFYRVLKVIQTYINRMFKKIYDRKFFQYTIKSS